ncbi:hypothetical protein M9H77_31721 [Catharanthus roseus]|uniref:Uncharacterized protein n=1 Tax=Catharanthus roseus TaxID=4058 RepID=A0ACC0A193_CATRO|nr:hypothetical protein M9H77_31721 [Catharanthus roseus]
MKTINFFPSNSYLSFEISFKEIKLFSLVFIENGYQFYFLNSLGTLIIKEKDKGRNMEKDLGNFLKDLPLSSSVNPSLMCYEVSLVELELFLESYVSHVSIYGDLCAILFCGGLFLVVSYVSTCFSSYAFLEDSLLHSDSMFDPSCHDFGVMNNASNEFIVVYFGLDGALFDILLDKCLGKFVENVGYVSSFLDAFVENHNDFVSLN